MPKISKTSKMQIKNAKVGSWSLPAGSSCPGSKDAEVCKSCYAKKGMYRFPAVKNVREYNRLDYHNDDWVDRMVEKVKKFDYFRWFDSGDIESVELMIKISKVIMRTKGTRHWLPTRSDKVPSIKRYLCWEDKQDPCNHWSLDLLTHVAVRRSADNIGLSKPERPGVNSYVINKSDIFEAVSTGIHICPVTIPGSTQKSCDTCTACYTDIKVAYVIH